MADTNQQHAAEALIDRAAVAIHDASCLELGLRPDHVATPTDYAAARALAAAGYLTDPALFAEHSEWGWSTRYRTYVAERGEEEARRTVAEGYPGMRTLKRRNVGEWVAVEDRPNLDSYRPEATGD